MLVIKEYDRARVLEYAHKWALSRNPMFLDFMGIGGDCTNFISQCVLAGCRQMNYTPTFGWYYINNINRAPAWTGVPFFYNFINANKGVGPFAVDAKAADMEIGDIIQLGQRDGTFYHTLAVTGSDRRSILVTTHSDDSLDRPLNTYNYQRIRYIHILGSRMEVKEVDIFKEMLDGIMPEEEEAQLEIDPEPEVEPSDEIYEDKQRGFEMN